MNVADRVLCVRDQHESICNFKLGQQHGPVCLTTVTVARDAVAVSIDELSCDQLPLLLAAVLWEMSRPAEKKVKLTAFSSVSWIQVQSMFEFSAFGFDAFSPQRTTFSSSHTIDEIVSRLTELERICGKINMYALFVAPLSMFSNR